MAERPPVTHEEAAAKLPAVHVMCVMGWGTAHKPPAFTRTHAATSLVNGPRADGFFGTHRLIR